MKSWNRNIPEVFPTSSWLITFCSAGGPWSLKVYWGVLYSKHRIGMCPPSSGTFLQGIDIQSLTQEYPHLAPTCRDSMEKEWQQEKYLQNFSWYLPWLLYIFTSPTPIISHLSESYFFYSNKTGTIWDEKIPHCKYPIFPKLYFLSTFCQRQYITLAQS